MRAAGAAVWCRRRRRVKRERGALLCLHHLRGVWDTHTHAVAGVLLR